MVAKSHIKTAIRQRIGAACYTFQQMIGVARHKQLSFIMWVQHCLKIVLMLTFVMLTVGTLGEIHLST